MSAIRAAAVLCLLMLQSSNVIFSENFAQKNHASVNGGLSGGSSVCRPGSEDQGCTKLFLAGNQPNLNINWLRDFMRIFS